MMLPLKTTLVISQVLFILHLKNMHTDFFYVKCYRMHSTVRWWHLLKFINFCKTNDFFIK